MPGSCGARKVAYNDFTCNDLAVAAMGLNSEHGDDLV